MGLSVHHPRLSSGTVGPGGPQVPRQEHLAELQDNYPPGAAEAMSMEGKKWEEEKRRGRKDRGEEGRMRERHTAKPGNILGSLWATLSLNFLELNPPLPPHPGNLFPKLKKPSA